MLYFLKKSVLFAVVAAISFFILFYSFSFVTNLKYNSLIDPEISNSVYVNQKMAVIRGKKYENLTLGSSISSMDIATKIVMDKFPNESYVNASSGGLSNKEVYKFLKLFADKHQLKRVFEAGAMNDYLAKDKTIDWDYLKNYLYSDHNSSYISFEKFRFENLLRSYGLSRGKTTIGLNTIFDSVGGELVLKYPLTSEMRLQNFQLLDGTFGAFINSPNDKLEGLKYLDSIAIFCRRKNIEFYYFQAPIGEYYQKQRPQIVDSLQSFALIQNKILEKSQQHFIYTLSIPLADSVFTDYQHMKPPGAEAYTKYCLDKIQ